MNKVFQKILTIILSIALLILLTIAWQKYLAYYWYTEKFELYQSNDTIRLCNGKEPVVPIWTPNEAYNLHIAKAEGAIKNGSAITIVVRGIISTLKNEVYVEEILELKTGINRECE